MPYPSIPLAYVPFLSSISKARAELPEGPNHVSVIAHHDKGVTSMRFAVENDAHWNEMIAGAVSMFNSGPIDTMAVFFPTSDKGIDAGYLLEGGKPPVFLEWHFGQDSHFAIMLIENNEAVEMLSKAVAFDTLKGLLDKIAGGSAPVALPGLGGTAMPKVTFPGLKPANQ